MSLHTYGIGYSHMSNCPAKLCRLLLQFVCTRILPSPLSVCRIFAAITLTVSIVFSVINVNLLSSPPSLLLSPSSLPLASSVMCWWSLQQSSSYVAYSSNCIARRRSPSVQDEDPLQELFIKKKKWVEGVPRAKRRSRVCCYLVSGSVSKSEDCWGTSWQHIDI